MAIIILKSEKKVTLHVTPRTSLAMILVETKFNIKHIVEKILNVYLAVLPVTGTSAPGVVSADVV